MIELSKYWDTESRLIKPNPHPLIPTFCQHNILECTGKILIAMGMGAIPADTRFIEMVTQRYREFWDEIRFMPRTISKTFLPGMQPEVGDWQQYEFKYWYMTATSTTQLCFFLMGLQMCGEILAIDVMRQIVKDGWAIKCKGKVVTNGNFLPFGLVAIQRYAIGKVIGKEPGLMSRIMLDTVRNWTCFPKNYVFWGKTQDCGEWFSTCVWLWWVKKLGEPQHFDKWFPKYRDRLVKWREERLANSNEADILSDTISLEIIKGMK